MNSRNQQLQPIAIGQNVFLRDPVPGDVERYIRWQTHGEWREYDAPWEGILATLAQEQRSDIARRFLEKCAGELPFPRQMAIIATRQDEPIGWVNRYAKAHERFSDVYHIGIDICEDSHLNRGAGTEALVLWVDYLFHNSVVHKIGLDTWSFNKRMIRVADKTGFVYEGSERELVQWQGRWLDLVHFGMLRQEWKQRPKGEL